MSIINNIDNVNGIITKIDILTYCSGYKYEVFDRFVGSLMDTGFSGNIFLVIKTQSDITNVRRLQKKYNNVIDIIDTIPKKTHICCHRFFVYKQILDHEQKLFNRRNIKINDYLFLCDSRDVLFQKNIEKYPYDINTDIYAFLEGLTIVQETRANTPWIKKLENIIGEQFYDEIKNNNIICCGTTLGKKYAIHQYVNMMCDIIKTHNITTNLDQGIHNYMLYLNKLDGINVKYSYNIDNLVNTPFLDVHRLNDDNQVVNINNDVSYVVHQYDRFSIDLKKRLSVKYNFML